MYRDFKAHTFRVKENHPNLLEDIKLSFDKKACSDFYETLDCGHGRIEERKCSIISDLSSILDRDSWAGLQAIVRLESKRIIKKTGEEQKEERYFITSLLSAEKILNAIRDHWGIENGLHWSLDMIFGEDGSSKRTGFSSQNFSTINKIVLNTIRKDTNDKRFGHYVGVNTKRLYAGWDDAYLMELLYLI